MWIIWFILTSHQSTTYESQPMKAIITHTTPTQEDKVTIIKGNHLILREEEFGTISVLDKGASERILRGAFKNVSSAVLKGKPTAEPTAIEGTKSISTEELIVKLDAKDFLAELSEAIKAIETVSDEYSSVSSRLHDLEAMIPDIIPRLDQQAGTMKAQGEWVNSLESTIQGFFNRFADLERRLGALDCPKPPVANPDNAPFILKDGICFLKQSTVEKGFVIDSNRYHLTIAETPDGRYIVKGMGLGLQTGGGVLEKGEAVYFEPKGEILHPARTEADSALAQRIDTADAVGTHPGDAEYPAPVVTPLTEADIAALEDSAAVEEAIEDDKCERATKARIKEDRLKR